MTYRHLYVHVPFCRRRCSYCDFSIAVRPQIPSEQFVDAALAELALRRGEDGAMGASLDTIYLGGGTPSLLSSPQLARLLDTIRATWDTNNALEITLEANPENVNVVAARHWRDMGINRVSLGVQSLHAETLLWMHRTHEVKDAFTALDALHQVDLDSISVDVIFGLPEHLGADPAGDAARLARRGVSHVSAYGLTVEPYTPLARWQGNGASVDSDDDLYARQFLDIHARLTEQGFEHYEISNYARAGHQSVHNSGYWSGAPFLGIGPAAHSYADGERWWNVRPWAEYARVLAQRGDPIAGRERLAPSQRWLEMIYLGLRTGVGLESNKARSLRVEDVRRLSDSGYLSTDARGILRATLNGWLCLDEVVTVLTTSGGGG